SANNWAAFPPGPRCCVPGPSRHMFNDKPGGTTSMRRAVLILLIAAAALGASAAIASADSSVGVGGDGAAVYFGDQVKGETLQVWQDKFNVYFEDDFQPVGLSGQGCSSFSTHVVACPSSGVPEVRIYGFGGNDTVDAGGVTSIPVKMFGGDGNDTLYGAPTTTHLNGDAGDDTLVANVNGAAVIDGGPGNASLKGSNLADTLSGGDGNDTYVGRGGADTMTDGGDGEDLVDYSSAQAGVVVDLSSAANGDGVPGEGDVVSSDIEDVKG